ncbi:hypothetical protein [Vreelandella sp. TE19]
MSDRYEVREVQKVRKKSWFLRKITDEWVFGEVLVIATAAIGIYALNFHNHKISSNPGDWAHFATYLSGTVGVAAVVATLIVLVRTFSEQRALIKSQDEQLLLSKQQLDLAYSKNLVDRAYQTSLDILPFMTENLLHKSQFKFPHYLSFHQAKGGNCAKYMQNKTYFVASRTPQLLLYAIENEELSFKDILIFVPYFFKEVVNICDFAFERISISPEIYYIFDSQLSKTVSEEYDLWFYVKCYYAFKKGVGDDSFCLKAEKFFYLEENAFNHSEQFWFNLGRAIEFIMNKPAE